MRVEHATRNGHKPRQRVATGRGPKGEWVDAPVEKLFEPRSDPKGWDRASITFNSHPRRALPRVPKELPLPDADSRGKLFRDCLLLAIAVTLLSWFPLWVASVVASSGLLWAWAASPALGVAVAAIVYVRGLAR